MISWEWASKHAPNIIQFYYDCVTRGWSPFFWKKTLSKLPVYTMLILSNKYPSNRYRREINHAPVIRFLFTFRKLILIGESPSKSVKDIKKKHCKKELKKTLTKNLRENFDRVKRPLIKFVFIQDEILQCFNSCFLITLLINIC